MATEGWLDITVVEASGFESVVHNAYRKAPNPFCVVFIDALEAFRTVYKRETRHAVWRRSSHLYIGPTAKTVRFAIYDRHKYHANAVLGVAEINPRELYPGERAMEIGIFADSNPPRTNLVCLLTVVMNPDANLVPRRTEMLPVTMQIPSVKSDGPAPPTPTAGAGAEIADVLPSIRTPDTFLRIAWDKFKITRTLGAGSFADVVEADYEKTRVAVKRLKLGSQVRRAFVESFVNEVAMIGRISHPHCLRLVGACTVLPDLAIITELMSGDLTVLIHSARLTRDSHRLHVVTDIAMGLVYLHARGLIHRDLKPGNVLFNEDGICKIADFGLTTMVQDDGLVFCGTPLYMGPEALTCEGNTQASDVWGFAVLTWEIFTRRTPYNGDRDNVFLPPGSLDAIWPESLRELLNACFALKQETRPTMPKVLQTLREEVAPAVLLREALDDANAYHVISHIRAGLEACGHHTRRALCGVHERAVRMTSPRGRTALHVGALLGSRELIVTALQAGGNLEITDVDGLTPWMVAPDPETREFLETHGARRQAHPGTPVGGHRMDRSSSFRSRDSLDGSESDTSEMLTPSPMHGGVGFEGGSTPRMGLGAAFGIGAGAMGAMPPTPGTPTDPADPHDSPLPPEAYPALRLPPGIILGGQSSTKVLLLDGLTPTGAETPANPAPPAPGTVILERTTSGNSIQEPRAEATTTTTTTTTETAEVARNGHSAAAPPSPSLAPRPMAPPRITPPPSTSGLELISPALHGTSISTDSPVSVTGQSSDFLMRLRTGVTDNNNGLPSPSRIIDRRAVEVVDSPAVQERAHHSHLAPGAAAAVSGAGAGAGAHSQLGLMPTRPTSGHNSANKNDGGSREGTIKSVLRSNYAVGADTRRFAHARADGSEFEIPPENVHWINRPELTLSATPLRLAVNTQPQLGTTVAGTYLTADVVVKVLRLTREAADERIIKALDQLTNTTHPNCTAYLGAVVEGPNLMLVMEPLTENLHDVIHDLRLRNRSKIRILYQIMKGLYHLHQLGICHGNLKPKNILFGADGQCQISDYLLPRVGDLIRPVADASMDELPLYAAPEDLHPAPSGSLQGDMWAFATVAWELMWCSGNIVRFPYGGRRNGDPRRPPGHFDGLGLSLLAELLQQCWSPHPDGRPGSLDLLYCLESMMPNTANEVTQAQWSPDASRVLDVMERGAAHAPVQLQCMQEPVFLAAGASKRLLDRALRALKSALHNHANMPALVEMVFDVLLKLPNFANNHVAVRRFALVDEINAAVKAHSSVAEVLAAACSLLSACSVGADTLVYLREGGAVPLVLASMARHPTSALLQQHAAAALARMAVPRENKGYLVESGALPALLAAMRAHTGDEAVQLWCCAALGNLASRDHNTTKLREAGAVQAIIASMDGHLDKVELQRRCTAMLGQMAILEANHEVLRQHGAIAALINAARLHVLDAEMQRLVGIALGNLAVNDDNVGSMHDTGAVEVLVVAMQEHSSNTIVMRAVSTALSNLVLEEDPFQHMSRCGVLDVFINTMLNHSEDIEVQRAVLGGLANMAASEENRQMMLGSGVHDMVSSIVDRHERDAEIGHAATLIIARLQQGMEGSVPTTRQGWSRTEDAGALPEVVPIDFDEDV